MGRRIGTDGKVASDQRRPSAPEVCRIDLVQAHAKSPERKPMDWGVSASQNKYRQQKRKKYSSVKNKPEAEIEEEEAKEKQRSRVVVDAKQRSSRRNLSPDHHAKSPPINPHQRWLAFNFKLASSSPSRDRNPKIVDVSPRSWL